MERQKVSQDQLYQKAARDLTKFKDILDNLYDIST